MSEMNNIGGDQPVHINHIQQNKGKAPAPPQPQTEQGVQGLKQMNLNDNPAFLGGQSQVKRRNPDYEMAKSELRAFARNPRVRDNFDILLEQENAELLEQFEQDIYENCRSIGLNKEKSELLAARAVHSILSFSKY